MRRPPVVSILVLLLLVALLLPATLPRGRSIVLATTTSTDDSGLLGDLLPRFTAETGIRVDVIAVGTGQALEIGRRGDADVVLTHAPAKEIEFLEQGFAGGRLLVMYNQFVVVGPPGDPAGISGGDNIAVAFEAIRACSCPFLSRGDDSGTHTKELELWRLSGGAPEPSSWYRETGQGMGTTLRMAGELGAYTLADDGTYAVLSSNLHLRVLVENDPRLRNQYSVMWINPDRHPHVAVDDAIRLAEWLTGPVGQAHIGAFSVHGRTVFTPNAG